MSKRQVYSKPWKFRLFLFCMHMQKKLLICNQSYIFIGSKHFIDKIYHEFNSDALTIS